MKKYIKHMICGFAAAAIAFVGVFAFFIGTRSGGRYAVAETVTKPATAGYSLILDGSIGVCFYLQLPSDIISDTGAYVLFTLPSKATQTAKISEAEYTQGYGYKFACYVSAKEMADEITAQIVLSSGKTVDWSDTYSVKEYANNFIALADTVDEYGDWLPVLYALLNYGAAAQTYFNYNVNNLANSGYELANTTDSAFVEGVLMATGEKPAMTNGTILTPVNCILSLESKISLVVIFKVGEGTNADSVTFSGAERVAGDVEDGYVYAKVENILPQNLADMVTVTSSDGASVTYSPMYYCYSVFSTKSEGSNLYNLVASLCDYYSACKDRLLASED